MLLTLQATLLAQQDAVTPLVAVGTQCGLNIVSDWCAQLCCLLIAPADGLKQDGPASCSAAIPAAASRIWLPRAGTWWSGKARACQALHGQQSSRRCALQDLVYPGTLRRLAGMPRVRNAAAMG